MRRVADTEPGAVGPGRTVIEDLDTHLVAAAAGEAELNSRHHLGRARDRVEDEMIISTGHLYRVWVETETGAVARFGCRGVVGNVDHDVVVNQRLHAAGAHQSGRGTHA